jgi:hypothetical protein
MVNELVDRVTNQVAIRRFLGMGDAYSRYSLSFFNYVRMHHFVRRSTYVPFRRAGGDVRREFMQRLSAALNGTLGSYLRDDVHKGSVDVVACLPFCVVVVSTAFSCKNIQL